jgi:hypothetical protein
VNPYDLTAVFQDTDHSVITSHEEEFDIPCESQQCPEEGRDYSHPAHYLVSMTCDCILYWCFDRMKLHLQETPEAIAEGMECAIHGDCWLKNSIPIRST